ncbi:hypothetical protein [Hymenobacter cavernae]|uniref:Uncharacterized protein n=1 Tax=Hymenobacter cavernae TaxID=2044852 RepID=A0ABQ1U0G5_9BACT|nr:hypothetical protein [Hymenobacter cavernae]GGF08185.1 hypothetical protein GCM10011383_19170 [Hymenobacter cavernae]
MPKTIDYPRTSYASAWEVAEVVDDTGGKCAIDTCARKLNRKVSGSFKAIIGSAVKFGLVTSKRELLTTTNLFRRIKHAYDKQEEKIYHREAFLNPPLFTQICRKFRNRELPVHMFDVILIREFGVEEINAQNVSKAFVDGARMVGVLDERNIMADIDQLAAQQTPRRELASTEMPLNALRAVTNNGNAVPTLIPATQVAAAPSSEPFTPVVNRSPADTGHVPPLRGRDAVSSLFGLDTDDLEESESLLPEASIPIPTEATQASSTQTAPTASPEADGGTLTTTNQTQRRNTNPLPPLNMDPNTSVGVYSVHIIGPGINSTLAIQDVEDLAIVNILLEKIRKQLK